MAPTPSLPLENLMPWVPPRTVVGRPLGLPGPRRRGDLGPREVRGAPHRRDDHPTSEPPGPAHVRRPRQARRGPRAGRRGRRRCGRIQRRAPTDDALRARARPARGMLRPPPRAPRTVRAARLEPGREAPGRAGPPSLRGPSPSGTHPRRGRRGAARTHGGRRTIRGALLPHRVATHKRNARRSRAPPCGLEIRRKVRLAARTLFPNVPSDSVIPVLTKADELPPEEVAARAHVLADSEFHRTPLAISVRTGHGLSELRDLVHQAFAYPLEIHLVLVPGAEASAHIHWLYEHTDVVSAVHGPERIEV